ncbi:hypothetical protein GCM10022198_16600 [Klugiella xanthotipulae]|uniref:Lipoprotein n=1 Tax=Klugiella xanthotipulae TaxID=244735 RepID=A0A543HH90_9MICO|nr:hypothetical protein [Klugiella xanthotipulae]TQM57696.1 hypothetical protein FB466_2692 [Klugiella xanthotipulae]
MTQRPRHRALAVLGLAGALSLSACSSPEIVTVAPTSAAVLGSCPDDLGDYVVGLFPGATVVPHPVARFSLTGGGRLPSPSCAFDITVADATATTLLYGFYLTDAGGTYSSITTVLRRNGYSLLPGSTAWQAAAEGATPGPIVNVETTDAAGAATDETPLKDAYILVTLFGSDGTAPEQPGA